jgi:cob(I)alamin adenosyltransferase
MGLLDKAKSAAGTATSKAREGVEEVQTKRELGKAYDELGRLAFELADSGQLTDERLNELVARIRTLRADLDSA